MTKGNRASLVGEAVRIELKKEAGSEDWTTSIDAESVDGVLYGLQAIIEEIRSITGLTVERVIALLAAQMLAGN